MTKNNAINTEGLATLTQALSGTGNTMITPYTAYRSIAARGLLIDKQNLGVTRPGGNQLTIRSAGGTNLSSTNYGTVIVPSKLYQGEFNSYQITSNQTVDFDDMTGNVMGTTASVAWSNNIRLFIYAVQSDAEDGVVFMLSRLSHKLTSPAAANIGMPSTAAADTQGSFFSFGNITAADYENNPCVCLGSVYATKDSSDAWTVNALDRQTGIGRFGYGFLQTFPTGQFGAAASRIFLPNGGTAANYTTQLLQYQLLPGGICSMLININNQLAAGTGAVNAQMTIPFAPAYDGYAAIPCSIIAPGELGYYPVLDSSNYMEFKRVTTGAFLLNSTAVSNLAVVMQYQVSES